MGKIVAITNQKGGVGKTTTAVNLAACLGAEGKKILVVDIDPQGNTTSGFGINKRDVKLTSYEMIVKNVPAKDVILHTTSKNVDIIPANIQLSGADMSLMDMDNRHMQLKRALVEVKADYDYIIMDFPPALGLIHINGLVAADTVIIPVQPEYYALEGMSQLIQTFKKVKGQYNPLLEIEGVVLTMCDMRLNLTMQVVEEIKKYFGNKVYKTSIPRTVRLSEAPSFGQPVIYYDRSNRGTEAYTALAKEFLMRNGDRANG
ncbi:MAG: ParA family protein [Oscillospiraceae bacterium]|nr:ParA family protein [Oscillospiraceae bacterium]